MLALRPIQAGCADGTFLCLPPVPDALLAEGFRRAVLEFLVKERAITDELRTKMLGGAESAPTRRHRPGARKEQD